MKIALFKTNTNQCARQKKCFYVDIKKLFTLQSIWRLDLIVAAT